MPINRIIGEGKTKAVSDGCPERTIDIILVRTCSFDPVVSRYGFYTPSFFNVLKKAFGDSLIGIGREGWQMSTVF
jgi:hypothetical protein